MFYPDSMEGQSVLMRHAPGVNQVARVVSVNGKPLLVIGLLGSNRACLWSKPSVGLA
jgi:hypothetical protein